MGDIKVRVYYSLSGILHLSDCGIGILVYVLYETLDFHYKKSFTFEIFLRSQGPELANLTTWNLFWRLVNFENRWMNTAKYSMCQNVHPAVNYGNCA